MKEGIIIACDQNQEWMLPFWNYHYGMHNSFPVFAVDFGMSEKGIAYCKKHFMYYKLLDRNSPRVASKEEIEPTLREKWENLQYGECWKNRKQWFKKPIALAKTPFEKTIWVDLDTEILGSVAPIFAKAKELSLVEETSVIVEFAKAGNLIPKEQRFFSSALIVFEKTHPVIQKFAEDTFCRNHLFFGDQELLCDIIDEMGCTVQTLPQEVLKEVGEKESSETLIRHFAGERGKMHLKEKIGTYHLLPFLKEQFSL